jgi:hypothetical protein
VNRSGGSAASVGAALAKVECISDTAKVVAADYATKACLSKDDAKRGLENDLNCKHHLIAITVLSNSASPTFKENR